MLNYKGIIEEFACVCRKYDPLIYPGSNQTVLFLPDISYAFNRRPDVINIFFSNWLPKVYRTLLRVSALNPFIWLVT